LIFLSTLYHEKPWWQCCRGRRKRAFIFMVEGWHLRACAVTAHKRAGAVPTQGLLEFIWTEGYSGQSSNPGLALAFMVEGWHLPACGWHLRACAVTAHKRAGAVPTQGLLEFIWTEGYSGQSSNPGLEAIRSRPLSSWLKDGTFEHVL
jgi:hypothetical protein